MFRFDHWADWFEGKVSELDPSRYELIRHWDNRNIPEASSNPSFGLNLDSADRIGMIGFWSCGLCDLFVINPATGENLAEYAGLEANDETVPQLLARFMSFYEED